jgi:hypothetical protein
MTLGRAFLATNPGCPISRSFFARCGSTTELSREPRTSCLFRNKTIPAPPTLAPGTGAPCSHHLSRRAVERTWVYRDGAKPPRRSVFSSIRAGLTARCGSTTELSREHPTSCRFRNKTIPASLTLAPWTGAPCSHRRTWVYRDGAKPLQRSVISSIRAGLTSGYSGLPVKGLLHKRVCCAPRSKSGYSPGFHLRLFAFRAGSARKVNESCHE